MAKKIRFPLDMGNGIEVRTLEELKDNFSVERVIGYYRDGRLVTWLRDRYLDDIADIIGELNQEDNEFAMKICNAFGVEYNNELDIATLKERNRKLELLKKFTDEKIYFNVVDDIAFNQEELYDLLDEGKIKVYLCGEHFSIPLGKRNMQYIGINQPIVIINAKEVIDFADRNIEFVDVVFDEKYQALINASNSTFSETISYSDLIDDFNNLKGDNLVSRIEKEIENETTLADKARYMLYQIYRYVPREEKNITMNPHEEIKKAAQNGYVAARIRCSLNFNMFNEEYDGNYRKHCCQADYLEKIDMEDCFVLYEIGVAHLIINESKAVEYIRESANMGCWLAEKSMGIRYVNGEGVSENISLANEWYKKAAEKGVTECYYQMYMVYFNKIKDIDNAQLCIKQMFKDQDYAMKWIATYKNDIESIPKKNYSKYNYSSLEYKGIGEVKSKSKSYVINKFQAEWLKVFEKITKTFDSSGNCKFDDFVDEYINVYENLLERWAIWMYGTGKTDYLCYKLNDTPMDYKTDIRNLLGNLLVKYKLNFTLSDVDEDTDYQWMNFSISTGGFFGNSTEYRANIKIGKFMNKLNDQFDSYAGKAHEVMKEYFINTLL